MEGAAQGRRLRELNAGGGQRLDTGSTVDVNTLLKAANVVVAALLVFALPAGRANAYIDQTTVALALGLCVQTHVALTLERLRRDPFTILLTFAMIFYFSLRVFTLTLFPFSVVFDRFGFDPRDANFALLFIIAANVLMYAGLIAAKFRPAGASDSAGWRGASPQTVVAVMVVTFGLAYFSGNYWLSGGLPRALTVLRVLLSPDIIVSMALAYYLVFRNSLSKGAAIAIGVVLFLEIAVHTLWGSRSAFIYFAQTFLLVALAVTGVVRLKRRHVAAGVALLPFVLMLMVLTFAISTYNRLIRFATSDTQSVNIRAALTSAREGSAEVVQQGVDVLLPPVFARAGFFDFSAEMMAHRDRYRSVVNLPAYGKSVVDNLLTPGFDVFDQPKTGNALSFVYLHGRAPSKAAVESAYQSDQLGIYGELYTLFGFGSLPFFFLLPYMFKRLYVGLRSINPFTLAMQRVVILVTFVRTVDSFGLDWVVSEMVPFAVAVWLYSVFFSARRDARRQAGATGDGIEPGLGHV